MFIYIFVHIHVHINITHMYKYNMFASSSFRFCTVFGITSAAVHFISDRKYDHSIWNRRSVCSYRFIDLFDIKKSSIWSVLWRRMMQLYLLAWYFNENYPDAFSFIQIQTKTGLHFHQNCIFQNSFALSCAKKMPMKGVAR